MGRREAEDIFGGGPGDPFVLGPAAFHYRQRPRRQLLTWRGVALVAALTLLALAVFVR